MHLPCPTPSCSRTRPGHHNVCRACALDLLRALADIPSLEHHLELARSRQVRFGDQDGSRSSETALNWDPRASDAIAALRSALVGWYRLLAVDEPRPGPICRACSHPSCRWIHRTRPPADTLGAIAVWLHRQHRAFLAHEAVAEAVDEIDGAVRRARRTIDRPPATWYAGPCSLDGCTADLYARHGEDVIKCRSCGGTHSAMLREQWLMRQVADQLGTATEIARALAGFHPGLTPDMLRGYAGRLRLFPFGVDDLGRPLYLFGDVRDLLDGEPPRALVGPACPSCRHLSCKAVRFGLSVRAA